MAHANQQTIYFLRHGESEANITGLFAAHIDPPLSVAGWDQIRRQSHSIRHIDFDVCYVSPLLRARQTAEILSESNGLRFVEKKGLTEVDVGYLDGKPFADPENWSVYQDIVERWEAGDDAVVFPGGESLRDIGTRFSSVLTESGKSDAKNVLLVGHCFLFQCAIWLFAENRGRDLESGHMGRGHLTVASLSVPPRFRMVEFNVPPPEKTVT